MATSNCTIKQEMMLILRKLKALYVTKALTLLFFIRNCFEQTMIIGIIILPFLFCILRSKGGTSVFAIPTFMYQLLQFYLFNIFVFYFKIKGRDLCICHSYRQLLLDVRVVYRRKEIYVLQTYRYYFLQFRLSVCYLFCISIHS